MAMTHREALEVLAANRKRHIVLTTHGSIEFTEYDARLLSTFANHIALAIENADLFERSRMMGAIEERSRVARDLHDTLAQSILGILRTLEAISPELEAAPLAVSQAIEESRLFAKESLDEARSLAREAFGERLFAHYLNAAREEQHAYDRAVTCWERDRYFERI